MKLILGIAIALTLSNIALAESLPFAGVSGKYKVISQTTAGTSNLGKINAISISTERHFDGSVSTYIGLGAFSPEIFKYGQDDYKAQFGFDSTTFYGSDSQNQWAVELVNDIGRDFNGTCKRRTAFVMSKTPIRPNTYRARYESSEFCERYGVPKNGLIKMGPKNFYEDFEITKN